MATAKRPMVRIHNAETGEILDREMNDTEFSEFENYKILKKANLEEALAKAAEKAALLERLGITEDEAKLLLS